jgi:DNA-directed RNA polymerase subunit RPC12/RpoP
MVALILVGMAMALAATVYAVRSGILQREKFYYFRCADCGQKLRYLASKAGRGGMCPLCRRRLKLPRRPEAVPSALDASGGYQVRLGQRGLTVLAARRTGGLTASSD